MDVLIGIVVVIVIMGMIASCIPGSWY